MLTGKRVQFGIAVIALCSPLAMAQNSERDAQDIEKGRITLIEAGTPVPIRTQEPIDVETKTERVYRGVVDQDVRDAKGHIAIPRGSSVDLKVRAGQGDELILDLDSINLSGERFGVWSEADHVEAQRADTSLATVVDQTSDVQVRGPIVRVPSDTLLTFRIDHAMIVGIQIHDPGEPLYARQNLGGLR